MSHPQKIMDSYFDIINALGKWKIIECQRLKRHLFTDISYYTLKKKIKHLESEGLVRSVYLGNMKKHVYLTERGLKFTKHKSSYEPLEAEIRHDLLVCKIMDDLSSFKDVIDVSMYHELDDFDISPDGMIKVLSNHKSYNS